MSKHNILTEEEFSKFVPNKRLLHFIEAFANKNNLTRNEINILDWGCGRGREALYLKNLGYNAYGVDIDIEPIKNGIELFKSKGYDESTLSLIHPNGKTDFQDNFYHLIFSNQVFEHVSNIDIVANEMARITTKGGIGYHTYPAPKYLVEGHLFMPFIHWLPKNIIRKYLISAYVFFGKEPHWKEFEDYRYQEKANAYYQYSINKTFYRSCSKMRSTFQKKGFKVSFVTINNPRMTNHKFICKLTKYALLKSILNYLLLKFYRQELIIEKQ